MALYIGYYRPTQGYLQDNQARARAGNGGPDPNFRRIVLELPEKLPSSCRIIGSYSPAAAPVFGDASPPAVMIVETDNQTDLQFISQSYAGYLMFQWLPGTSVGTTRAERDVAMTSVAQPAGVR